MAVEISGVNMVHLAVAFFLVQAFLPAGTAILQVLIGAFALTFIIKTLGVQLPI